MRSDKAQVAVLLYGLVALVAISLGFWRGNPDIFHHPQPLVELPYWLSLATGIVLGLVLGQVVVWLSQRSVKKWKWKPALRLHIGLRQILGVADDPLKESDVMILALSSSIAEELFFRGLFVPWIGLWITSIVFGLLHYAPRTRGMWIWIPMASVMGVALGGVFIVVGNLTAPIVAHFYINYRNLHFINNYDPKISSEETFDNEKKER